MVVSLKTDAAKFLPLHDSSYNSGSEGLQSC